MVQLASNFFEKMEMKKNKTVPKEINLKLPNQKKLEMDFSDYKPGKKWIETKCNEIFKND
jgi:hypothetical protein